jgi:type II secretory pathway component GspD/PulD (secretin)
MRTLTIGVLLFSLLFALPLIRAEKEYKDGHDIPKKMLKKISLDIKKANIVDALNGVSKKGGLDIAISKKVSGYCTLRFNNATLWKVFITVIQINDLAYVEKDGVYHVMTAKEYKTQYGTKYGDPREVKTFRLTHASPKKAFMIINGLKSNIGKIMVDQDSGIVVVRDIPARLEEMEKALAALEQKKEMRVFRLKHVKAKDIEKPLKKLLQKRKLGEVTIVEKTNQVIIECLPGRMEQVKELISQLDEKATAE